MSTKVIVIAVVAVMVVAGAGAGIAIYANNNDDKNNGTGTMKLLDSDINGTLQVYGNVDGDLDIDEEDYAALEKAINEGKTSTLPKYADANYDGTIDASDLTKLREILDASTPLSVEVKHVQRHRAGDKEVTSMYPVEKAMSTGAGNMLQMFKHVGICKEIVGVAYSGGVDSTLLSEYQFLFQNKTKYQIGTSAGYADKEKINAIKTSTGAATLISADEATYLRGDGNGTTQLTEAEVEAQGIDVIRVAHSTTNMTTFVSDLALLAFFFDIHTDVSKYNGIFTNILTEMNNKLNDNVGEGKKYSVVTFGVSSYATYQVKSDGTYTNSDAISGGTSDYTALGWAAGGSWAFEGAASTSSQSNRGAWTSEYNVEKIIVTATGNGYSWYGGTADEEGMGLEKVKERILAYGNSEPFYNGEVYVLSGDMPIIMRVVYTAHMLYPQLFSKEWADNFNKEYSAVAFGMSASQIDNGNYFFSMEDLGIEGH